MNDEKLEELLRDADIILSENKPIGIEFSWERQLQILAIYAVINQLWQNPQDLLAVYVEAIRPVILAAFELGRRYQSEKTS